MVVFGQNWFYSDNNGCIPAKWLYSGKSGFFSIKCDCIRAKWLYSVKSGCI